MTKGFMDGYRTYDTSEGYGSAWEWKKSFHQRVSKEEADEILGSDDPYKILGISRGSSITEIKSAFRKLAWIWQPDLNPYRIYEATKKMLKIN